MRRISGWYMAAVGSVAMYPFLALHLTRSGLSDAGAAATLALLPLGTLLAGPLWSWRVDRIGNSRGVHRTALGLTTLAVAGLLLPLPSALLVVAIAFLALVKAPIFPLADAATIGALGAKYGTVRAVGSLAYVAVVLVSGLQRETMPLWPIAVPCALLGVATLTSPWLPELPPVPAPKRHEFRGLIRTPGVRLLLLVIFLNGLSLTTYDHLFSLHMHRMGVSTALSGAAIAWGVFVEVLVMFAGPTLMARLGSGRLLILACAAGVPRYILTAWLEDPIAIGVVQGLHGFQFGAFWLAAVHRMAGLAPENLKRSAQSLVPATGFGLATLTSLLLSATWLSIGGTRVLFLWMSAPALAATLAAVVLHLADRRRLS